MHCLKEELKVMQKQRSGAIVNAASTAGLVGLYGHAAYCPRWADTLLRERLRIFEHPREHHSARCDRDADADGNPADGSDWA